MKSWTTKTDYSSQVQINVGFDLGRTVIVERYTEGEMLAVTQAVNYDALLFGRFTSDVSE